MYPHHHRGNLGRRMPSSPPHSTMRTKCGSAGATCPLRRAVATIVGKISLRKRSVVAWMRVESAPKWNAACEDHPTLCEFRTLPSDGCESFNVVTGVRCGYFSLTHVQPPHRNRGSQW